MRAAIHVSEDTHSALCAFCERTGMKKGAVADRAVLGFIASPSFACLETGTGASASNRPTPSAKARSKSLAVRVVGNPRTPAEKLVAARAAVRAVAAKAKPVVYEPDPQATPFGDE